MWTVDDPDPGASEILIYDEEPDGDGLLALSVPIREPRGPTEREDAARRARLATVGPEAVAALEGIIEQFRYLDDDGTGCPCGGCRVIAEARRVVSLVRRQGGEANA